MDCVFERNAVDRTPSTLPPRWEARDAVSEVEIQARKHQLCAVCHDDPSADHVYQTENCLGVAHGVCETCVRGIPGAADGELVSCPSCRAQTTLRKPTDEEHIAIQKSIDVKMTGCGDIVELGRAAEHSDHCLPCLRLELHHSLKISKQNEGDAISLRSRNDSLGSEVRWLREDHRRLVAESAENRQREMAIQRELRMTEERINFELAKLSKTNQALAERSKSIWMRMVRASEEADNARAQMRHSRAESASARREITRLHARYEDMRAWANNNARQVAILQRALDCASSQVLEEELKRLRVREEMLSAEVASLEDARRRDVAVLEQKLGMAAKLTSNLRQQLSLCVQGLQQGAVAKRRGDAWDTQGDGMLCARKRRREEDFGDRAHLGQLGVCRWGGEKEGMNRANLFPPSLIEPVTLRVTAGGATFKDTPPEALHLGDNATG